ncbi:MAG: UDP-2,3-diacylglucosamine diphosphatase [SAR116 cluster bacterium]|jgi:UDP-2,3-diacylglucosamine hydrolase|nr:UDP-2,3-diacylglucosamine diphosphatase [SAR116 cluster bacterium]|tara:strand:+ start:964 stop:1674 length:711 start_codon:yes stop_codon:yes gene_type:complete
MTQSLFISDLHLSEDTPHIEQGLVTFLEQEGDIDRLFLLGDIFEAWIGDDDDSPLALRFADAMKRVADAGTQIYFTRGNRDFLIGQIYLNQFGAKLLGDSECMEVAGESTLLMHGDLLCSDDVDYLAFRAIAHNPEWQAEMLSKSLEERRALAKQLRTMSKEAASNKAEDIMDVNDDTVRSIMAEHDVKRLIHGHTHRPYRHPMQSAERIVLGDWNRTGWCLRERGRSLELREFLL